jgi:sugar phosphate isomerase/epimerase
MSKKCFHPSVEGAQHGAKSLEQFLAFAKESGAEGAQPSNFMLQSKKNPNRFMRPKDVAKAFEDAELKLDGISAHCPLWVHTTAWTGSPTIRPFTPEHLWGESSQKIEKAMERYILNLLDLCAELGIKVVPMFWGIALGWELATGYPWGFWKGANYDLLQEGLERFVKKTRRIRTHANALGIKLAHEIHPGTAAMCANDFGLLMKACSGEDKCLAVNADPSHCWEGEGWPTRFRKVGKHIYACHVKNFVIRKGLPLRSMAPNWPDRAMQFVDLPSGEINLARYVELLINVGYPQRYCQLMGTETAPLIVEAESAYRDLDATSANGINFVRQHLCFPLAAGSFEDGMGA